MATNSTTIPPSIPPPSDTTAPSTSPSTASSIVNATKPSQGCTSSSCPIKYSHDRGLYLHSCHTTLSTESRRIFSPSVPSPDVLAAYERCIRNYGTSTDVEMWVTFHELHVEPLLERTDAVWVAPVPTTGRDDNIKTNERTDPRGVEANDEAEECRHPFGLSNPPDQVWEAHRRLVLGEGSSGDQELVDIFAVKNAYYGNGLGKQKTKQRRIERELESKKSKQ